MARTTVSKATKLNTDADHGNRGGGSLHSTAVANGAAGFMSGADKAKLDGLSAGVTSVGATAPITSSGGTTPTIGISAATPSAAGSMSAADKADHDTLVTTTIIIAPRSKEVYVRKYATGDGVTDDTTAIRNAYADAGRGRVIWTPPNNTYLISDTITLATPDVATLGYGVGDIRAPMITLAHSAYGKPIFDCTADHITIEGLSGQYGPTTTLAALANAGATTITVADGTTISSPAAWSVGTTYSAGALVTYNGAQYRAILGSTGSQPDINPTIWDLGGTWLILDQSALQLGIGAIEQAQVQSISGNTIALTAPLAYAHPSGVWVRNQMTVPGSVVYGFPPRDQACFAHFVFGSGCSAKDIGVVAMVGGVRFRGDPRSNSSNTSDNTIDGLITRFVQFGTLNLQQDNMRLANLRYRDATSGQTTAPGHSIYQTIQNGFATAWNNSSTYSQYQQRSYDPGGGTHQYISLANGNVNHLPTDSAWWKDEGPTGYKSYSHNLTIRDYYAAPGASQKNWAGFSLKGVKGGTCIGGEIEQAVRSFNMEQCEDFVFAGASFTSFVGVDTTDSAAAAIDVLNCKRCRVESIVVDMRMSDGSSIDQPVVFQRASDDAGVDPNVDTTVGAFNTFANIKATTNYSASYAGAAFRAQGRRNRFIHCELRELGGHNQYAYRASSQTGVSPTLYADYTEIIQPKIEGTDHIVTVDAGTTGVVVSYDPNLIPASPVWNIPTGTGTRTSYSSTNVDGSLTLNPTSTSADILNWNAPASFSGKHFVCKNSAGVAEFQIDNQSGTRGRLLSSSSTAAVWANGLNTTGGYPANAATFAGYAFTQNGTSPGTGLVGMFAIAAEAQDATHLGTDLSFQVIPVAGTSTVRALRLHANGDVSANPTGSLLATGATGGFFFPPRMTGKPTGSVVGHTGTVGLVYDDSALDFWINTSSTNWRLSRAMNATASGPANGSTFLPGSFNRVSSGQSGNAYVLTDATTCSGSEIKVHCTNSGGTYSFTFTDAGGHTIAGTTSYTFVSDSALATITFISDGANWHVENPVTAQVYSEDSPQYHGYVEWNGNPQYGDSTGRAPTTANVNVYRIQARAGGSVSNIVACVRTLGSSLTAATTANVTAIANNGSGLIRVTLDADAFATDDVITIASVGGTTEANAAWAVTRISSGVFDLQGSTFTNAYTSGGVATRSANCCAIYDSNGALVGATGDQVSAWGSTGTKSMALAKAVTLTKGAVYYIVLLYNGTALAMQTFVNSTTAGNPGISGNKLRFATNGTGSKLPKTITTSSNSTSNAITTWIALS